MTSKIYVIDDDPAILKSVRWLLESVNFKVETYSDALLFLNDYRTEWQGCLLIDVRMPNMSGLQLQEQLIERGNHMPIIMLSGHADVDMAVRAMKTGALDFITKPFNEDLFLERIQKAMSQRKDILNNQEIIKRYQKLTERERKVMDGVVSGKVNKVIADELHLSSKTIEVYRANVMDKMEAKNLAELIRLSIALNIKA